MNFIELIEKKKNGRVHSQEEIKFITNSICDGSASDAQITAWLMAVCFNGLNIEETAILTEYLAFSGKKVDFSELAWNIVDKHSTGGVGDKVTITLIPLLAASGVPVAKLACQGIGATAGTLDKLESIPNINFNYSSIAIVNQVKNIKAVIASQSENMAPADKKLCAIRNLTGTADCPELIASSILSKKIATGANILFFDVKYGSGALIKTSEEALDLSRLLVNLGKRLDKSVMAVVTSMDEPLGRSVGNSIEVIEAIEFLKGNEVSSDLAYLTYYFAALILVKLGLYNDVQSAKDYLQELVNSGKAIEKFKEIISSQGGDIGIIDCYDKFELPSYKVECASKKKGFVQSINARDIAFAVELLGGVRNSISSTLEHSVGVYLNKKTGEYVEQGEVLYTIYSNDEEKTIMAQHYCDKAFLINDLKPIGKNIIYKVIGIEEEDV